MSKHCVTSCVSFCRAGSFPLTVIVGVPLLGDPGQGHPSYACVGLVGLDARVVGISGAVAARKALKVTPAALGCAMFVLGNGTAHCNSV